MSSYKWCSWCCCCRPSESICCRCCLCNCCCRCPPPCLPQLCPMPQQPCMPCMGPPPPPCRIIREQVIVPVPVPIPMCSPCVPCRPRCPPTCAGDYYCKPCSLPPECCYEPDPEIEIYHPCPPAYPKRLFRPGCSLMPGYQGHVPGLKLHGAGRTFSSATKDTSCIMSQWGNCCPRLPRRIFEQ